MEKESVTERSVCEQRKTLRKSNGQNRRKKNKYTTRRKERKRERKSERKLKALVFGFRLRLES